MTDQQAAETPRWELRSEHIATYTGNTPVLSSSSYVPYFYHPQHGRLTLAYLNAFEDRLAQAEAKAALADEMRAAIEPLGDEAAFTPADGKWWASWAKRYDAIGGSHD